MNSLLIFLCLCFSPLVHGKDSALSQAASDNATSVQGLNSKHLAIGAPQPSQLASGKVRVYGMRFCPYTQRAVLSLRMKHVPFEVVNLNLDKKPEWYSKLSPTGKVPTVEHDGRIVTDSLIASDYINDAFPNGHNFIPTDPYERAKQKMLVDRLSVLQMALHSLYADADNPQTVKKVETAMQLHESLLHGKYYAGESPGYADLMVWPWLERLSAAEIVSKGAVKPTPKLAGYMNRMKATPQVKTFLLSGAQHLKYMEGVDYDEILKE